MPAVLRKFTTEHTRDEYRTDGADMRWSRHRDSGLEFRVTIELDADAEFVDKLNAFFREQVKGPTTPIPGPRLEERTTSDRSDVPRLPPGPIEGEFIDDVPRRKR